MNEDFLKRLNKAEQKSKEQEERINKIIIRCVSCEAPLIDGTQIYCPECLQQMRFADE